MNSLLNALILISFFLDQGTPVTGAASGRESTYWAAVDQYTRGDRSQAHAALRVWTGKDVEAIVDSVESLAKAAKRCSGCESQIAFDTLPLRSAVLLHSERERADRLTRIARGGDAECSTGTHAHASERLLGFASRQSGGESFLVRFAAAMSLHYRATLCFDHAWYWAGLGLKANPKDQGLLLARGLASEAVAEFGHSQPPPGEFPKELSLGTVSGPRDKRKQLTLARKAFEDALASNPRSGEAHLRLGRVQWRLGRLEVARAELEKALGLGEAPTLFLAHLFLGRVLEDSQDLDGALREYRAALALEPQIQTAVIALAHVRALLGDMAGAREVLAGGLPLAGQRKTIGPYWDYLIGKRLAAETLFEELRVENSR